MRDFSPKLRLWIVALAAVTLFGWSACQRPPQDRTPPTGSAAQSAKAHDLSEDESRGGHTLRRHVGRTDAELKERLEKEPNISAASTYTDRVAAENAVGIALEQNQSKIERWLQRSGAHPNLVLDYDGDPRRPLGRSLRRGESPEPCSHAVVVLRWDGQGQYYVLTSYPECR